jgi:hypothetical protein
MKAEFNCIQFFHPSSFCLHPFFRAFPAQTKNRKVIQIGRKGVLVAQFFLDGREHAGVHLGHFTALAADEMMVMRVAVDFVRDATTTKISRIDQSSPDEQVERAIHRRFVEVRVSRADARDDFVGGKMSAAVTDDLKNHFTLRGAPMPALSQVFEKFGGMHDYS